MKLVFKSPQEAMNFARECHCIQSNDACDKCALLGFGCDGGGEIDNYVSIESFEERWNKPLEE